MPIDIKIKSDLSIADQFRPYNELGIFAPRPMPSRSSTRDMYGAIENYRQGLTSINNFQFPADRPKFYTSIKIMTYSRRDLMTMNVDLNTNEQIILPVPFALTDTHGVSYTEEPFGAFLGSTTNHVVQSGIGALSTAMTAKNGIQELGDNIKNNADKIGEAALGVTAASVTDNFNYARQAAGALAGLSPNQFFTILLKGPQYKRHNMQWHLSPRNASESRAIKQIIARLNNSMAPGLVLGGAMFNFPKVFQLAFYPNYNYLYKFKPAILENMQIEYAPNGLPAFYHSYERYNPESSPPESVKITCQFLELEYWLHNDFKPEAASPYDTNGGKARESENVAIDTVKQWVQTLNELIEQGDSGPNNNESNNE